jgi:hypothetical protein
MNILKLKANSIKYIIVNIVLVFFFAILYYCSNYFDKDKGIKELHESSNSNKITFSQALGYSLITQTTVGYTVFIPMSTYTKNVNMVQLFTIFIVLGMFL